MTTNKINPKSKRDEHYLNDLATLTTVELRRKYGEIDLSKPAFDVKVIKPEGWPNNSPIETQPMQEGEWFNGKFFPTVKKSGVESEK